MDTAEKEFANPAVSQAMTAPVVAPPPPAAPAGITQAKPPAPTTGVGTLQAMADETQTARDRSLSQIAAEKQAAYKEAGIGAPGTEQREKLMAERANAADEAERTKWMRAAKFFASWGSTPGSTLVAGMAAVRESVPDMINDAKEAKKIRMEIDKTIAGLDEATRLEKKGLIDEAYVEKMKLGEKTQALNIKIAEIKAQQELEDKKTERGEKHDLRIIAAQKEVEGMKLAAQREIKEMEGEWRKLTASNSGADRLQRLYSDVLNRKAVYENQISSVMKSAEYQRASEAASMDATKSPAAAKMQREGALALESFEKNFKTMRDTADEAITFMSGKVGLPPPKPTMSADDESAYKWAKSNPSDPRSKDILSRLGK